MQCLLPGGINSTVAAITDIRADICSCKRLNRKICRSHNPLVKKRNIFHNIHLRFSTCRKWYTDVPYHRVQAAQPQANAVAESYCPVRAGNFAVQQDKAGPFKAVSHLDSHCLTGLALCYLSTFRIRYGDLFNSKRHSTIGCACGKKGQS